MTYENFMGNILAFKIINSFLTLGRYLFISLIKIVKAE